MNQTSSLEFSPIRTNSPETREASALERVVDVLMGLGFSVATVSAALIELSGGVDQLPESVRFAAAGGISLGVIIPAIVLGRDRVNGFGANQQRD